MKTTYKVLAGRYRGHREGEEFQADLTADEERRAKDRGSIRVVSRGDEKATAKTKEKEGGKDV